MRNISKTPPSYCKDSVDDDDCIDFGDDIHLLFKRIEVVNDDPDEEVEGEEGATDDEDDKVEVVVEACFILRLLVNLKSE